MAQSFDRLLDYMSNSSDPPSALALAELKLEYEPPERLFWFHRGMPNLLDRPSDDALRFLRVVANGYTEASGAWPCWQWVRHQLWAENLDAESILRGLPTWQLGYRSVRTGSLGQIPDAGDPVPLSIHGLSHTVVPATTALIKAFLAALKIVIIHQRGFVPSPTSVIELKLPGADITRAVNMHAGTGLSSDQLYDVLRGEPATWRGVNKQGDEWSWDLTDARLAPYVGVINVQDYLAKLEEIVGVTEVAVEPESLPPMALPDALDHLDLAWRLAAKDRLVQIPRAAMAAKLTQPASSIEEFESRCSALADLLNSLNLPGNRGTLQNMKTRLSELLGDEAGRARDAVDVLRWAVALRAGQQHQGADARAQEARVALGLARLEGDWLGAWDHLRTVTVRALATIREEVSTLIE
jgi:hypothetical protein